MKFLLRESYLEQGTRGACLSIIALRTAYINHLDAEGQAATVNLGVNLWMRQSLLVRKSLHYQRALFLTRTGVNSLSSFQPAGSFYSVFREHITSII